MSNFTPGQLPIDQIQNGDFVWTLNCANPAGFGFRVSNDSAEILRKYEPLFDSEEAMVAFRDSKNDHYHSNMDYPAVDLRGSLREFLYHHWLEVNDFEVDAAIKSENVTVNQVVVTNPALVLVRGWTVSVRTDRDDLHWKLE